MGFESILTFVVTVVVLFVILKVISAPFKLLIKFLINSVLGGLLIYVFNIFGAGIGLNIFTSIFVGITGIPGAILLFVLNRFIL